MLRKIIKNGIFSFSTFNPYTLRITYKPYMFLKVQILEFKIRQPKMQFFGKLNLKCNTKNTFFHTFLLYTELK